MPDRASLPVSVVIPAFNAERFLPETLESIRAQTCQPTEVVMVDDGSTDGTGALVAERFPEVRVVRAVNSGCGAARGLAIAHSRCEWIAPCDADDLWHPEHLARKFAVLQRFPGTQVAFSNCYSFGEKALAGHTLFDEAPAGWFGRHAIDDDGERFQLKDPYAALLEFHPAYQTGLMFRRDIYDAVGGFLPKYSRWVGEDSEFIRRVAAIEGLRMVGDRMATWGYRRHGSNMSGSRWKNYACKPRILKEHLTVGAVPTRHRDAVLREIDRGLAEAFDVAVWDRANEGALGLYQELPPEARTIKRRLKLWALRWQRPSAT
jgi:glycosyltransferase involved in cell wall biosynthesis